MTRYRFLGIALAGFILLPATIRANQAGASGNATQGQSNPTLGQGQLIDLKTALMRAHQYGLQVQSADLLRRLAHEDTRQARAASLPSVSAFNQFIYTEGNGTPSGVFVANDGVHIYNEQAIVHEELLALARRGEIRLAAATEAVARARVDIAARGLDATVVQNYYAIAAAQQKTASSAASLSEARRFFDITQKQEQGGEAAHSDVIKAQLQVAQREREMQDAELSVIKAKVALGVFIFPTLETDYEIVDDLAKLPALAALSEVGTQAKTNSADLRAAQLSVNEAQLGVNVARYGYLPSLSLDFFYGINANQFAARSSGPVQATGRSTLPNFLVEGRQNLGYAGQVTLNIPVWNWGAIHSRVKQASYRQELAKVDLTTAERNLQAQLQAGYREAQTALSQVNSLRSSSDLSAESLRLTVLRYQAGEATALEVVDAQSTLSLARNAYVDGLYRYRVALSVLQALTGVFLP